MSDLSALLDAVQDYFDALYNGDAELFAKVMHQKVRLYCPTSEPPLEMNLSQYQELVRGRPSPSSRNDPRLDRLLFVSIASPTTAHVRVEDAYLPRFFTDDLTFMRTRGEPWRIISKIWHFEVWNEQRLAAVGYAPSAAHRPTPGTVTTHDLYLKFQAAAKRRGPEEWALAVFEGSPAGTAYSWCSDCVAASADLMSFITGYKGRVRTVQFKVGTREEWEGPNGSANPFRATFPFLSDLPTAILFYGRLDVARTIAPRKSDLMYLAQRADVLEEQKRDGSWKPPRPIS